jgi:hypothetical protein
LSASSDAPPAAVLGGRLRLRLIAVDKTWISLDPDNRKDDDRRRLAGLAAETHNAPIIWKFDNGAHPSAFLCRWLERDAPMRASGISDN